MNKSIIKQIFNGFKGTAEQMRLTEQERILARDVSDAYDELKQRLTPEQLKFLNAFENAIEEEHIEELDHFYVEGFKLGLLIGIECMDE